MAEAFPEFACFAPDPRTRVDWFERQRAACCIEDGPAVKWREKLSDRPLENQELDELLEEFRLTPQHWVATMHRRLRAPAFGPADLVPASLRYFDRLTGEPPEGVRLPEFVRDVLAAHARAVVAWDVFEGLKLLFALSAHQMVSEVIDLTTARREDVEGVFRWLVEHGDRVSQVGAIECGLRHLPMFPEIEGDPGTVHPGPIWCKRASPMFWCDKGHSNPAAAVWHSAGRPPGGRRRSVISGEPPGYAGSAFSISSSSRSVNRSDGSRPCRVTTTRLKVAFHRFPANCSLDMRSR